MRTPHRLLLGALLAATACGGASDPASPSLPPDSTPPVTSPTPGPSSGEAGVALAATDSLVVLTPGASRDLLLTVTSVGVGGPIALSIDAASPTLIASLGATTAPAGTSTQHLVLSLASGAQAPATGVVTLRAHVAGASDRTLTIAVSIVAKADPNKQPYAAPSGTPFTLPAGITATLQGFNGELEPTDAEARTQPCYGRPALNESSRLVAICLRLTNANGVAGGQPVRIVLPGGLLFLAQSELTQGGLLVWNTPVEIPPRATVEYILYLYCATPAAHASTAADAYRFGPVPQHPLAQELLTMLADRTPVSDDDHDNVQAMVWLVAENGDNADGVRPLLRMLRDLIPAR